MPVSSSPSSEIHYFKELVNKVAISLQYSDSPNIFLKEQSLIIRDIQNELEHHPSFPNNISEFITGLKYIIKKEKLFKKALLPSQLQQNTENDVTTGLEQESIFRLLLSIDCIQNQIISVLLEEVTAHAVNDEEDKNWIRLLLGPLRYLSYIKNSQQLAMKLLEILEVATYPAQLEILYFIPDIIPDSEYDETAKQLIKILNQSTELTSAIICCLNYLNLSVETRLDIQDHILAILNSTLSLKTFSLIFSFLVTDCKQMNLPNILLKSRNALDSILSSQSTSNDNESDQVVTFQEIQSINISSKFVSEGWINLITSFRSANDHKSVDIIILLMLHSAGNNRKHVIEGIFKKKIKNKQLKSTLLETTLQKYLVPQILKEYIESILEIAAFLLRLHTPEYLEFARIFYSITFGHKYADKQQRQQILNSLIFLTGSGDGKKTIPTLSILETISEKSLELLQPHTMQLMVLLDKIEEIHLGEVKQIFDLLCNLTCGPKANESMNVFQNDIFMIVKKQLNNSNKTMQYRGIIAAVATAKNIATILDQTDSNSMSEESISSISDLPSEPAKQAANLLELANTSTLNCPIAQGLYYDQLAQMVVTIENLDTHFMTWLFYIITNNFQEIYVSEDKAVPINDIPITIQFNLNSNEELEEAPIAVKIAELTIKAEANNNLMLVFAPLFRLLRLIHFRQHEGSLSTIGALLGCGIALPEIDPDVGIENFDSEQSKQVIDCLFHCINWFREIISAFVTQKGKTFRQKILNRLKNLVELEDLFLSCMKSNPDHKLPPSYFYNINLDTSVNSLHLDRTKSAEKGKKQRTASLNNTTKISQQTTQAPSTSKAGRKSQNKEKVTAEFQFREMDTDIILLLKYPMIIGEEPLPENNLYLTVLQYKFIIKDLVMKLNSIIKPSNNYFTHLITVNPDNLITDCVKLMPHINKHLIKIIDEIKKLLHRSDGIHDAHEMFQSEATELKLCFSLTLELQALVLNWPGFQNNKNLPLLREYLRACVDEQSSQLNSAQKLILEYLKCIMALTEFCLTLPCAVHLINIVHALCNITTDDSPKKKLILLSGKLLSNRWFNLYGLPETGAAANVLIDSLVKAHLNGSNLETVSSIVSWIHSECPDLKGKDDNLTTFPSITKSNFPILYRGICATLSDTLQSELQGLTNTEHLEVWLNAVTTMRNLMDIVKAQETRANVSVFFKKSMAILKIFLNQGLPILEIMLRNQSDKVVEILRTLQQTTRFIHNLCCHSKVTKDSALMAHVPQMRLTLESLVYRVKAALFANNCTTAFWMGNLRNKNIHGEEILSQSSNASTNSQQQEDIEEELPPDEDESEHETNCSTADESSEF